MTARMAVTTALATFVAASVLYLVAGPSRPGATRDEASTPAAAADSRVIAYYLHATMRCRTCLAIENGAHDAIERAFPEQLAGGALVWRSLDLEETGNEHFVTDFGITASSLVLAREEGGRVTEWRNLPEVWDLVGDDTRFDAYVIDNTRAFLGAS